MKLSLIMPIYNAENYLRNSIESVIKQPGDYEFLLIDDGSSDSSLSICQNYADKDIRIRILHTENKGVSHARNAGIDMAKGEYIQFIDSDDMLTENSLSIIFKWLENNDDVLVFSYKTFGKEQIYTNVKDTYKHDIKKTMEYLIENGFIVACWNKVYKKSFIGQNRFRENLSYAEDYCFNLNVFKHINSISIIPQALYLYRKDNISLSSGFKKENFEIAKQVKDVSVGLLNDWGLDCSIAYKNFAYDTNAILVRCVKNTTISFLQKRSYIKTYCCGDVVKYTNKYYPGLAATLMKMRLYSVLILYLTVLKR